MSSTAPLTLKPLTRYKRRDGGFATVTTVDTFLSLPMVGLLDAPPIVLFWSKDGRANTDGSKHPFDLVEEIPTDPPAAVALVGLLERERDDLKRDLASVTEERNKLNDELVRVIAAIPIEFTLEPPDGGDVKSWEAVNRLASAFHQGRAERDALLKKLRAITEFCGLVADTGVNTMWALKSRIEAVKSEIALHG